MGRVLDGGGRRRRRVVGVHVRRQAAVQVQVAGGVAAAVTVG